MRQREFLMLVTLLTITLISVKGKPTSVRKDASRDKPVPASEVDSKGDAELAPAEINTLDASPAVSKDKALLSAYLNTVSILSTNNSCSLFFGGSAAAVDVFKHLIGTVQKDYFTTPIGIRMSGATVSVNNITTGTEYRLFDKVSINADGPFYRSRFSRSDSRLHRIGTFEPNTNEARVLMLLHELGHVMKGDDKNWLLADDGKDAGLSQLNSRKIEDVCGTQINALRKLEGKGAAQMMVIGKTDYEPPAARYAAPARDKKNADQVSRTVREN